MGREPWDPGRAFAGIQPAQTRPCREPSSPVRLPHQVVWIQYVGKRTEARRCPAVIIPPSVMSSSSECPPSGSGQETPEPRQDSPPSSSLPSQPFATTQRPLRPQLRDPAVLPSSWEDRLSLAPRVSWKGVCGFSTSALSGPQCVTPQGRRLTLSAGCGAHGSLSLRLLLCVPRG